MAKIATQQRAFNWPFGKKNYLIFGLGLVAIILGYITLANTAVNPDPLDESWGQVFLTLSPALLILGYCVLIPISIIIGGKQDDNTEQSE
ncbi:hypothetical protein JYU19_00740 [bacterium AH-315-J21]|nr:hypothetical protein [bacterium AH-315-J21]